MTDDRLCIVPMKPLARAKARLADVLSPDERRALSLAMLTDVVRAARTLERVWVLCSDDDAAATAEREGAQARPDPTPDGGLNASLDAATADAVKDGMRALLIVSADCPAATPDDVRAMALGRGVTLAPNRTGTGTNALWRMPPDAMPECYFGERSRQAHESYARTHGIPFAIVARQRLALDVDSPADLATVFASGAGDATRAALANLGYPQRATGR